MSKPSSGQTPLSPARVGRLPHWSVVGYLTAAVVLGVLADVGLRLGESTAFLFIVATPWVVLAFGAGRLSGFRWSAGAGAGTLLAGLAAYYLWLWGGQGVSLGVVTGSGFNGVAWALVGAVAGGVAGVVGGLSRHHRDLPAAAAWCGVAAVPCVDATLQLRYGEASPMAVVAVFGAAALALLAWAWRSGARLWMLSVGVPVAAFVLWQLELTVLQQVFGRLTWI